MGSVYDEIDGHLRDWILRQSLFFVGTAPASVDGHVNVSPKGPIGTLRVLGPRSYAYLDMVGSGAETVAHLRENGRIVIMLCAFDGPPRIARLHGRGEVAMPTDPTFHELVDGFEQPDHPEARRAIVIVEVTRIADSCGYGVPLMRVEGQRPHMNLWAAKKLRVGGPAALVNYQREKNTVSIDGLQGIELDAANLRRE
ncbi:MAG: pyridoxamine 5'-phosphate oxidase family protein [Solirubrobacteraceae bacterium]